MFVNGLFVRQQDYLQSHAFMSCASKFYLRSVWSYQVLSPVGPDICYRGCAYTVLQIVQRHGVYSAACGTVHYEEPLKSFEIRVGHSPGFGLHSIPI